MYSNQLWDNTCKIFDNFNDLIGIAAGINYVGPNIDPVTGAFPFLSWNNVDGKGNLTN